MPARSAVMYRVARTLGNIPLSVGPAIVAYLDDLEVCFVLDKFGELEAVEVEVRDGPTSNVTITKASEDRNGRAIWWAASLEMIEHGDEARDAAGFAYPEVERPSAPIYGVDYRHGRYSG